MKKFDYVDFSEIEKYENKDLWFIHSIDSKEEREAILEMIKKEFGDKKDPSHKEICSFLMKKMSETVTSDGKV